MKSRSPISASEDPPDKSRRIEAAHVDSGNINSSAEILIRFVESIEGWFYFAALCFPSRIWITSARSFGMCVNKVERPQVLPTHPAVRLMRTTVEKIRMLGEANRPQGGSRDGPTCIMIPLKGMSAIDQAARRLMIRQRSKLLLMGFERLVVA